MLRRVAPILLAPLILANAASNPEAPQPMSSAEIATAIVEMREDPYRRMTVPVSINGKGPYRFMIDTGAEATVLSHMLADLHALTDRRNATLIGMVSARQIQTAIVPELSFGARPHYDARAALVEGDNIGGADGILGLDTLQGRRVLMDFANRRLEIVDSTDDRSENRGFEIIVRARQVGDQLLITRAKVDGVRTAVVVDTGAQGSIGNAALYNRLRRSREGVESEMTDINGIQATTSTRIGRSLEFDRARIGNFPIAFVESPTFAALGLEDEPALILGMNELHLFERVAIDFASRRVLFDLPDGTRISDRRAASRFE